MDDIEEFQSQFLNEFSQKLTLTKAYQDFFQDVQEVVCNTSNVSLVNMNEFLMDHIKNSSNFLDTNFLINLFNRFILNILFKSAFQEFEQFNF